MPAVIWILGGIKAKPFNIVIPVIVSRSLWGRGGFTNRYDRCENFPSW
jgi:hypothetical protein